MRAIILAAAAVACLSFAMPAQARIANPTLNVTAPNAVETVHYRRYRHSHYRRGYTRPRHYNRRRHCYNQRIRVRVPGGHFVWRTTRRCAWR